MTDEDLKLSSPKCTHNLPSLIIKDGATLDKAFALTPVCCTSRTENILGRYFHNSGVPGCGCMNVAAIANAFSGNSVYSILHDDGYKTGIFDK